MVDVRADMHHDRHVMAIRRCEHPLYLRNMTRLVHLHVRVAEVKLETSPKPGIPSAAIDLSKRVVFQRIDATERPKAIWVKRRLRRRPVILFLNPLILIRYGGTEWVSTLVRNR